MFETKRDQWEEIEERIDGLRPFLLTKPLPEEALRVDNLGKVQPPIAFYETTDGARREHILESPTIFRVEKVTNDGWRVLCDVWDNKKLFFLSGKYRQGSFSIMLPRTSHLLKGILWFNNILKFLAEESPDSEILKMYTALTLQDGMVVERKVNVKGWENYLTTPATVGKLFYRIEGAGSICSRLNDHGFGQQWFKGKIPEPGQWMAKINYTLEHPEHPGPGYPCTNCGAGPHSISVNILTGGVECLHCFYKYGTTRNTKEVPLKDLLPV